MVQISQSPWSKGFSIGGQTKLAGFYFFLWGYQEMLIIVTWLSNDNQLVLNFYVCRSNAA